MKSTHTKGEWKKHLVCSYGKGWYEIHYTTDGECVAEIVHNEADADLFAASKDMYLALKEVVSWMGEHGGGYKIYEKALDAISKAEGNI